MGVERLLIFLKSTVMWWKLSRSRLVADDVINEQISLELFTLTLLYSCVFQIEILRGICEDFIVLDGHSLFEWPQSVSYFSFILFEQCLNDTLQKANKRTNVQIVFHISPQNKTKPFFLSFFLSFFLTFLLSYFLTFLLSYLLTYLPDTLIVLWTILLH